MINPDFSQNLVRWFKDNKRDLPWRRTNNPYYIWISEIMLQQTQVDTVIPYFNAFINQFPEPEILAQADESQVLKAWEGLGYYSRARNLHQGVKEVVESYGGHVPDNKKDIRSIKGIGPYTAGAILSIAFNQPEPAVDGNVMRVMSRVLLIDDDTSKQQTKQTFERILSDIIPEHEASAFNQGLMELGALICKPKQPLCEHCPVREQCLAFDEGVQTEYPVKKKKAKQRHEYYGVLFVQNDTGDVLIRQRPDQGLLAGLWEFPMVAFNHPNESISDVLEKQDVLLSLENTGIQFTHTFTHIKWHMDIYKARTFDRELQESFGGYWVNQEDLDQYPFPVSHQKVIQKLRAI